MNSFWRFRLILYIIGILLYSLIILQTRNLFFFFFVGIMVIGGTMNIVAVASNNWRMPCYLPRKNLPRVDDGIHFFFNDTKQVTNLLLCDIIGIYFPRKRGVSLGMFSIGDILIFIGVIIGLTSIFVRSFL